MKNTNSNKTVYSNNSYAYGGPAIDWKYFKKAYDASGDKRSINWDNLKYADVYLNAAGYSLPQRQAIIYNMYQESGGDPKATSEGKKFKGLLQWDTEPGGRYSKIAKKTLPGQMWYLHETLYGDKAFNGQNWQGMTKQATRANQAKFTNARNAQEAMDIFTKGYVRPQKAVTENRMKSFQSFFPNTYDRIGNHDTHYNTVLTPIEELQFRNWRMKLPQNLQSDYDYDLRGAFINGYEPDENGHMTDLFKKPNHPTFSYESYYSNHDHIGGDWDGEKFIPSEWNKEYKKNRKQHSIPSSIDFYYNTPPGPFLQIPH